jgi:hypothetical protein
MDEVTQAKPLSYRMGEAVLTESDRPDDIKNNQENQKNFGRKRFVWRSSNEAGEQAMAPLKEINAQIVAANAERVRRIDAEIHSANMAMDQARSHLERAAKIQDEAGRPQLPIANAKTTAHRARKLVESSERLGIPVRDTTEGNRMEDMQQLVGWFEGAADNFSSTPNDEAKRKALILMLELAVVAMSDLGGTKNSLDPFRKLINKLRNLTAAEISKLLAVDEQARGKAAKNAEAYAKGARAGFSEFLKQHVAAAKRRGPSKMRIEDIPKSVEAAQGDVATLFGDDDYKVIQNLEGRTVGPALKRVKQWPAQASDDDRAMEMGYREALLRLKIESEIIRREKHAPGPGPESDDPLSDRDAVSTSSDVLRRVHKKMFPERYSSA